MGLGTEGGGAPRANYLPAGQTWLPDDALCARFHDRHCCQRLKLCEPHAVKTLQVTHIRLVFAVDRGALAPMGQSSIASVARSFPFEVRSKKFFVFR